MDDTLFSIDEVLSNSSKCMNNEMRKYKNGRQILKYTSARDFRAIMIALQKKNPEI